MKAVGETGKYGEFFWKNICARNFLRAHISLQFKIFIGQSHTGQLGGTGRHPLQRIIAKSAAVGAGGHHAFFGAEDLILPKLPTVGTVGTTGLN